MNRTFELILGLVERKNVMISDHGYDELAEDGILVRDIVASVAKAVVVEDYPEYPKGPVCSGVAERYTGQPDPCSMGNS